MIKNENQLGMFTENIKTQMRKGMLDYCILLCLSSKEAYTAELIDKLRQANMVVVEGTLYPLLSRMKSNEQLDYHWVESNSGPPRKYYFITERGRQVLNEMEQEWISINNSLDILRKN